MTLSTSTAVPQSPPAARLASRVERAQRTESLFGELSNTSDAQEEHRIRNELVVVNRQVAEAVAARYRGRGLAHEDLHQVACEALVKAVARFDPGLGHNFLTYAVPTISGEVRRHFRDHGWTIRPARRIQELQWQIKRSCEDLAHVLGREPTEDEVTVDLGLDRGEYAEAMAAYGCFQPTSLDQPVSADSETTVGMLLAGETSDEVSAMLQLAPVVRRLSERDRRILYLRFFEDQTQTEIGEQLGVTQMQVSRLLTRILDRLRDELTKE